MHVKAQAVAVMEDHDVDTFLVAFAEQPDGSGRQLQLQASISKEWSESDIECGFDTYCLLVDTGATVYGGVTSWSVEEGHLKLELTNEAASTLRVGRNLDIEFAIEKTAEVKSGLERVFSA